MIDDRIKRDRKKKRTVPLQVQGKEAGLSLVDNEGKWPSNKWRR